MNLQPKHLLLLPLALALLASYNNDTSNDRVLLKTKDDSVNFARLVMERYPEMQLQAKASVSGSFRFAPIDIDTVRKYGKNYERFSVLSDKGFMIDAEGLTTLRDHPEYKQLYLMLGKRSDQASIHNDYTIMLIPLDADSKVIATGSKNPDPKAANNYDYLDPCPVACPKGLYN